MAKAYLNDTTLQAIANAIRTQTNTTATLLPSDMPAAISMIGGSTLSTLEETGSSLRYWPGWDKASWVDIKFIMDEYGMNRRPLPKDIKIGAHKLFKIGDQDIMFELKDIINNILLFRALSATTANILSLDNDLYALYENSEDKDCLTNDKIFMLAKERNAITQDDFEYNMMFAIGFTELGPEYNGRREDEEEIEQ